MHVSTHGAGVRTYVRIALCIAKHARLLFCRPAQPLLVHAFTALHVRHELIPRDLSVAVCVDDLQPRHGRPQPRRKILSTQTAQQRVNLHRMGRP